MWHFARAQLANTIAEGLLVHLWGFVVHLGLDFPCLLALCVWQRFIRPELVEWSAMLLITGWPNLFKGKLFELEANREVEYGYESTDGVFRAVIDSPQYPENKTSVNMTTIIFTNVASGPVWINVARVSQQQDNRCGFEIQSPMSTSLVLNIKCDINYPQNSWNVAWPSSQSTAIHLPASSASVAGAFRIYLTGRWSFCFSTNSVQ